MNARRKVPCGACRGKGHVTEKRCPGCGAWLSTGVVCECAGAEDSILAHQEMVRHLYGYERAGGGPRHDLREQVRESWQGLRPLQRQTIQSWGLHMPRAYLGDS